MLKRLAWLTLLILVGIGTVSCGPYEYNGAIIDPPKPLNDFTLNAHTGDTFRLSDYQGQYVLAYFGYTFCPDVCPTTLFQAKRAFELLGEDADQVQMVMITVDPGRDTADQLGKYVTNFDERFLGLRADDPAEMDTIMADFGAWYEIDPAEDSAADYLVSHTASMFLINPDSAIIEIFTYGKTGEEIASDIRHLLKGR